MPNHFDSPTGTDLPLLFTNRGTNYCSEDEASDTVNHGEVTGDNAMKPFSQPIPIFFEPDRNYQPSDSRPESAPKTKPLVFWGLGKRNLLDDFELPVPAHTCPSEYSLMRSLPVDQGKLVSSFKRPVLVPAAKKAVVPSQADQATSWSILKVPGVQHNVQKSRETFERIQKPSLERQVFTRAPDASEASQVESQANSSVSRNVSQPSQVDGRSPISTVSSQSDGPPTVADMALDSIEIKIDPEDSDTEIKGEPEDSDDNRTLSASPGETISHEAVLANPQHNALGGHNLIFFATASELATDECSPSPDPGKSHYNNRQSADRAQLSTITQDKPGSTAGVVYSPALARLRAQFSAPSFPMPSPLNGLVGRQASLTSLQCALAASRVPTNLASQLVSQPLTNGPVGAAQAPDQTAPTPTHPLGHVHTFGHVNRRKKGKSYWAFSLPHQAMIRDGGGVPPLQYIAPVAVHHSFFSNAPPKNMDLSRITIPMTAKELLTFTPRHSNNHQFQHRMEAGRIRGADQAAMIGYQRDLRTPDAPLSNTITLHIMNAKKTAPANPDLRLQTDLSPSWWTFSPHNKEIWDSAAIDYPLTALGNGVNSANWPVLNDRGPLTMALEHATRNGHHSVLLSELDTYIAREGLSRTLPAAALSVRCKRTGKPLTPDQDFMDRHKKTLSDFRLWLRVDAETRGYKWL